MTREQFDVLEDELMAEVAKRKSLGGYNTDAPTIEFLCRAVLALSQHISAEVGPSKMKRDR